MEFMIKEAKEDKELRVTLVGKLDFARAPLLVQDLDFWKGQDIRSIIFECDQLTYLSSAGIRAIIYAHQKISPGVSIVLENVTEDVYEVVDMCGLSDFTVSSNDGGKT